MAWNQPGNNGQDRDPWGSSKPGGNPEGNGNKGGREQGPPDLDDIFRKLSKKLGGLGGGKGTGSGGGSSSQGPRPQLGGRVFTIAAAAIVIIWAASGFYTIKEAERGVVTRFGKFSHLVEPGLNWKPTFIDEVTPVNVEAVRELAASGVMLTSDENVVRVEMNVQYRVTDPQRYLFSVTSADDSLRQATDSALRGVIGKYTMDRILTEGRTVIRSDTQRELEETIRPYNMGITLLDVNFQAARPPEEVKAAFDDAIAARETNSSTSVKQKRTPTKFSRVQTVRLSVFWKKRVRIRLRPSWKHRVKWLASQKFCRNIKPHRKLPASVCISKPWKKC